MSELGGRLGYFLAGVLAAVLAMVAFDSAWAAAVRYDFPSVIVRTEEIEAREPNIAEPTIVDRIIFRTIEPARIAIAPGGGLPTVENFCRPVTVSTSDTVEVVDTLFLVRSGTVREPPLLAPWREGLFRATGPTNVGDLVEREYRPRGSFAFETSGDGLLVRQGRFAGARDGFETVSTYWTLISVLNVGAGDLRFRWKDDGATHMNKTGGIRNGMDDAPMTERLTYRGYRASHSASRVHPDGVAGRLEATSTTERPSNHSFGEPSGPRGET